tara:strand:- start:2549 stop:3553 length:1005 start_codon:yes stop_codon:yes gene_type:complete
MDLYSVSQATSFGNQVGQGVNSENRFRQAQNELSVQQAIKATGDARSGESDDIAKKFGGDATSLAETPGNIGTIARLSKSEGLIAKTGENLKVAGSAVANTGSRLSSALSGTSNGIREGSAPLFSTGAGAGRSLGEVAGVARPEDVRVATAGSLATEVGETGEDTARLASGINAGTKTFDSVAGAGSLTKFGLNKVLGITDDLSLEVGSKAVGGLGGAISAETDISNLITTHHVFTPHESFLSEAGNIGSMAGALLDIASIAVPVLAPFAVAVNLASAAAGTVGNIEDDSSGVSADQQQVIRDKTGKGSGGPVISPAWSSVGMVASTSQRSSIN